jgi:hypothetical protein
MQLRRAQKSKSKLRIGLAGPSGSGKTYSALLLANGITTWDKIVVIDTERQSADLYSDLGAYNVITLAEPFTPQSYIDAIKASEEGGMVVIIVDSITHEWTEAKNMVDKLGGRFQDWAKVTPIHNRFVDAIVGSKCHIITSVRSKTDYAMSTENGKTKVQKVGLKAEARDGFEYELTVSFDLNINHLAEASKDRTGQFMGADPFIISQKTGKQLLKWSNTGIDGEKIIAEIAALLPTKATNMTMDGLRNYFKVDDLATVHFASLQKVLDQVKALPDKKDEPLAPPEPPNSAPNSPEQVNIGDIPDDLGSPDATKTSPQEPEKDPDWITDDAPDTPPVANGDDKAVVFSDKMATAGDVKLFEAVLMRRAKQMKKGYEPMLGEFLAKMQVAKIDGLSHAQIHQTIDLLTAKNKEYDEKNIKADAELTQAAEDIFGAEAKTK